MTIFEETVHQKYLIFDYETFSEIDLKKVGAYEYAIHPSTQILTVAWKSGTREELKDAPVFYWTPFKNTQKSIIGSLIDLILNPAYQLVAHNAFFEQMITRYVLMPNYCSLYENDPSRWVCTASLAAALALPRSLEGAGEALQLPIKKDMPGHRLMLKLSQPRKPSKHNPSTRHLKVKELQRLFDYCVTDIEAETELFLKLPLLNPKEKKIWELDQKINAEGFFVDQPTVSTILRMIEDETRSINARTYELTQGQISSATQRDKILNWIRNETGFEMPDLRADTVRRALEDSTCPLLAKTILEFRRDISRTSTAKYKAFELRSGPDSRLRDILLYWGASTGRWGGRGIQPQNFPRGTIKDTDLAIKMIQDGDLEWLRVAYGNAMEVFSSCLRGMIMAPPGYELHVADYAAIEPRVLFWVAGHEAGLKSFYENRDIYIEMASSIYGKEVSGISTAERQLGKAVVLGCGYQMGPPKFLTTCLNRDIVIDLEMAQNAVQTYRQKHFPIPLLWKKTQMAAIAAIQNPGKAYWINKIRWWTSKGYLWCQLPSGRKLAYAQPQVTYATTAWGEKRPVIEHWGVDSLTKKWSPQKTYGGLLVENVVQAISRDLMAEAMLRLDETGRYKVVLSVHDELLTEAKKGKGSSKELEKLMEELPAWAMGCPIKAKGWSGERYRK